MTLGTVHLEVPGLARSDYVEMWCDDDWGCLVGDRAAEIVGVWSRAERLEVIGTIDRLILDGYDPGGLNRVDFVELSDGGLLVVSEIAVALVTSDGALRWQHVHDRLTARLRAVVRGIAWFDDEDRTFGLRIADGRAAPDA